MPQRATHVLERTGLVHSEMNEQKTDPIGSNKNARFVKTTDVPERTAILCSNLIHLSLRHAQNEDNQSKLDAQCDKAAHSD